MPYNWWSYAPPGFKQREEIKRRRNQLLPFLEGEPETEETLNVPPVSAFLPKLALTPGGSRIQTQAPETTWEEEQAEAAAMRPESKLPFGFSPSEQEYGEFPLKTAIKQIPQGLATGFMRGLGRTGLPMPESFKERARRYAELREPEGIAGNLAAGLAESAALPVLTREEQESPLTALGMLPAMPTVTRGVGQALEQAAPYLRAVGKPPPVATQELGFAAGKGAGKEAKLAAKAKPAETLAPKPAAEGVATKPITETESIESIIGQKGKSFKDAAGVEWQFTGKKERHNVSTFESASGQADFHEIVNSNGDKITVTKNDILRNQTKLPAPELAPPTRVAQVEAAIPPAEVKPTPAAAPQPGAGVTPPVKPPRVGKQQIYGKGTPPPTEKRINQPRTFDEGTPPPETPIITGSNVGPETPPGIVDDLAQADAIVKRDKPGIITRTIDLIPGLKQIQRYAGKKSPGVKDNILSGWIGLGHTHSKIRTALRAELTPTLNSLESAFGKGTLDGSGKAANFIGTTEQHVPFVGTLYDVMQRPQLYDLTDVQRQLLRDIQKRNSTFFNQYKDLYGFDMGEFNVGEGVFLRNVDMSALGLAMAKSEENALVQGATKERFYQTGADRWLHDKALLDQGRITADKVFKPNVNVVRLLDANDNIIAGLSSHEVFQTALGGKTKLELFQELHPGVTSTDEQLKLFNPRGHVLVQEGGLDKYFPAEDANQIRRMLKRSQSPILHYIDDIRATAFGGDLSPATIQGSNAWLMDPLGVSKTIGKQIKEAKTEGKFFNAFQQASIEKRVANNAESARMFTMSTGLSILKGMQREEFGTGLLAHIPKVGKFWTKANDAIYRPLITTMWDSWEGIYQAGLKSGLSKWDAAAIAADDVTKLVPNYSWRRLGMSQAEASQRRALVTSVSFLTQPISLMSDATKGIIKLGTLGHVKPTPTEVFAMKRVLTLTAMASAISASTAAVYANRKGRDPGQAALEAVKPGRWAITLWNGERIGIGGPTNSILRAVAPGDIRGVPVPVPFAGIGRFAQSKTHPVIGTGIDIARNKDFFDRQIITGQFPINVLQGLEYAGENVLPLTPGTVVEGLRTGASTGFIAKSAGAQFAGVNLSENLPEKMLTLAEQKGLVKPGEVKPGEPLPPAIKRQVEQSPEGRAIIDKSGRITPAEKARRERRDKDLQADASLIAFWQGKTPTEGAISPKDWRNQMHEADLITLGSSEWRERLGEFEGKEPKNEVDKVLAHYYKYMNILRELKLPVDEVNERKDRYMSVLTLDKSKIIIDNIHPKASPLRRQYYEDMRSLKPWFDMRDNFKKKFRKDGFELVQEKMLAAIRTNDRLAQQDLAKNYRLSKAVEARFEREKEIYLRNNEIIDELLIKWGYRSNATNRNVIMKQRQGLLSKEFSLEMAGAGAK